MSTHCISMIKNFNLSLKIKEEEEEEAISMEKQGIVSILDNVDSSSLDGEEDHHDQLIKDQPIRTFDWSSILSSSKNEDSSNKLISTSPYVHPLDKSSTSCLSEKSLEICTESLGSETGSGSDCFSTSPTSYNMSEDDQQQQQHSVSESFEDFRVVKYNYSKQLITSPKSFPPSLLSVHMQSRRQNGRLTLEAVSVPPKNSFHAQRLKGHLLLTFINQNDSELEMENCDDEVEAFEKVFDDIQEVEGNETPYSYTDDDEEEEDEGIVMEHSPRSEVTDVNRTALIMLEKKNQLAWSKCTVSFSMTSAYFDFNSRFNRSVNLTTEEEKDTSDVRECCTYPSLVSQTFPPPREVAEVIAAPPSPPPAATTSLNAYEYFWRKKPTVVNIVNNSTISTTKKAACTHNKAMNTLVPLLRSCKEPRRSLREPYCIVTS
ncbi:hypothetical protein RND71_013394 [Anisodus tanguticus]|uniref:FAF domain-containing protein n=1 Tax=Anisodus tanguticus TaxID=243964 RepID=A0AAE1SHL3_9SOLA|nr:hypothetical protein RND71_013394 [Anisodus tanguticus]